MNWPTRTCGPKPHAEWACDTWTRQLSEQSSCTKLNAFTSECKNCLFLHDSLLEGSPARFSAPPGSRCAPRSMLSSLGTGGWALQPALGALRPAGGFLSPSLGCPVQGWPVGIWSWSLLSSGEGGGPCAVVGSAQDHGSQRTRIQILMPLPWLQSCRLCKPGPACL